MDKLRVTIEFSRGNLVKGFSIFFLGLIIFWFSFCLVNKTNFDEDYSIIIWLFYALGITYSIYGGISIINDLSNIIKDEKINGKSQYFQNNEDCYREYKALLDNIQKRGSQIHTVFSILIASSIIVLTPLFDGLIKENTVTFPLYILPLISLVLIIATISFYVTSIPLDNVAWKRVNQLEHRLRIEGNKWLGEQIPLQFRNYRKNIWSFLLSTLLTVYTLLFIFSIYFVFTH